MAVDRLDKPLKLDREKLKYNEIFKLLHPKALDALVQYLKNGSDID